MNEDNEIDIQILYKIFIRRKRLFFSAFIIFFLAGSTILGYKRIFKPWYKGGFSLLISNPIEKDSSSGSSQLDFFSLAKNTIESDIPTLKYFLKSPIVLQKFGDEINPRNIQISLGRDKQIARGILQIKYKGRTPYEVKNVLGLLEDTYINTAKEERRKRLISGLDFLDSQYPLYQSKKEKFEKELSEFRAINKLIDPNKEAEMAKKKLTSGESNLRILRDNKNLLNNFKTKIQQGTISALGFTSSVSLNSSNNSGFQIADADQSRFEEITNIEKQLSTARTKYKPSSIMVTSLLKKYNSLKPELIKIQLNAVDKAIEINDISIKRNLDQIEQFQKGFKLKPNIIRDYNTIAQNLEISTNNVLALLKAKENFQLQLAQESSPWQILSPTNVDLTPFSPKIGRSILLIIFFSGFSAGLLTYLREKMDNIFHNPSEVEDLLRTTILANIPYVSNLDNTRNKENFLNQTLIELDNFEDENNSDKENLKEKRYEKFLYQESFRNLYTSIRYVNIDKSIKKLLITSSVPKEGKTLINIVLSKTLADIGLKVLLIDGDMRKPQIHKRLGLDNILGFSNLLIDKKKELKNVIQNLPTIPNLDILTSGRKVPDTTILLRSERMKEFVKGLDKENYDYIIFDTPPVLGLSDASLVSEHCDGAIIIVSMNNVKKDLPLSSIEQIKKSANLLGLITNGSTSDAALKNNGYGSKYNYTNYVYESYSNESPESQQANNSFHNLFIEKIKNILKWLDK